VIYGAQEINKSDAHGGDQFFTLDLSAQQQNDKGFQNVNGISTPARHL